MSKPLGVLLSPLATPPPGYWREQRAFDMGADMGRARVFVHGMTGLRVLASVERHSDGKRWAHVSCSYGDKLPSWDDLRRVKDIFLGDVMAYQVLPPASEYVNMHPHTLHLWHCMDGDPFPPLGPGAP